MILTIHSTGSRGNFNVVEFSNGKKIIVDFGKTSKYSAYRDFCAEKYKSDEFEFALITHRHNDHNGDVEALERLGVRVFYDEVATSDLVVKALPLIHNVECNGYMVYSILTNELYVHCTDFSVFPQNPLRTLVCTVTEAYRKGVKIMFACELAYCDFLYKKLPENKKIGLENHCSLSTFCKIMNMIPADVPVVTLHASGRDFEENSVNASVCPKDWIVNNVKQRCRRFVNFGTNKMKYYSN